MGSVSQGIHNALCIGIIDMGTQNSIYGVSHKVALLWELYTNDQVKVFSREYTLSYYKSATLRLHLESWRGKPFTNDELSKFKLCNVLGVPCKVEIRKNQNGAKQVENIYPFPKDEKKPISKTKYILYNISDEKTYSALEYIPTYLLARIKQAPEYLKSNYNKEKD